MFVEKEGLSLDFVCTYAISVYHHYGLWVQYTLLPCNTVCHWLMKGQCFFLYSGFLQFFITLRKICLYLLLFVGGFMSYLHYLCVCVYIVVWFFLLCLPLVSCVPYVASFSGLSIFLLSFWCSVYWERSVVFFLYQVFLPQ